MRYKDLERDHEESLSGRFDWSRRGDAIELALLDPLGQTVALIRSTAAESSITFRDGRTVVGATPEALTQQTLGWTVPLRGLSSWLDGRAAPEPAATPIGTAEGAGRFRQDGWTIAFTPASDSEAIARAGAQIESKTKPKRIDLSFPGPPVEIEMRLVVDRRSGS